MHNAVRINHREADVFVGNTGEIRDPVYIDESADGTPL
jgi:hypothetical protein